MLKISKLIPLETVRACIAGQQVREIKNRYSGFTLGLAFTLIGDAMTNPEKIQSRSLRDLSHAIALRDMLIQVITTSGLQFLEVKQSNCRVFVTYKPFYTPEEWENIKREVKTR